MVASTAAPEAVSSTCAAVAACTGRSVRARTRSLGAKRGVTPAGPRSSVRAGSAPSGDPARARKSARRAFGSTAGAPSVAERWA